MPNSGKMQWPYPARDTDPWFNVFESMVSGMDASAYSSREDRSLIVTGGGNVSFVASTGVLTWSAAINFLSPISGFKLSIASGSVALLDGDYLYTSITRSPTGNGPLPSFSGSQIPNTDNAIAIAVRDGSAVYFRNGARISDGESKPIFDGGRATHIEMVKLATKNSHDSNVPLVVGGDSFDPTDYDKDGFSKTIIFRAVASNGNVGLTNNVILYNATDNDMIATLSFTSTSLAKDEIVLAEGSSPGQIDSVEKIYEVRIALGAVSGGPLDTIELLGAEIVVINTPI